MFALLQNNATPVGRAYMLRDPDHWDEQGLHQLIGELEYAAKAVDHALAYTRSLLREFEEKGIYFRTPARGRPVRPPQQTLAQPGPARRHTSPLQS